jgi:hypothetical protein
VKSVATPLFAGTGADFRRGKPLRVGMPGKPLRRWRQPQATSFT